MFSSGESIRARLRRECDPTLLVHKTLAEREREREREFCRSTGSRSSASRKGCSIGRARSLVCISRTFRRGEVGEPRRVTFHAIVDTLTTTLAAGRRVFPPSSSSCRVVLLHCRRARAICDPRPRDGGEERTREEEEEKGANIVHILKWTQEFFSRSSLNFSSSRATSRVG